MLNIDTKRIFTVVSFLLICCFASAQPSLADVTIVTEPTTNSTGNNGKMTITIDPASAAAPFTISISGPAPYVYNNTTSDPVTILTDLRFGNYTGTIVDNSGCTASIATTVQKCKTMPSPGGGVPSIVCELPSEPHPGGGGDAFYATGTVNTFMGTVPSNFTFQVFHALPAYLYDQISPYLYQTMISEIIGLAQTDYSPFEIFEQDEFQSDAPYIFSFNADGSLIWVFRNLNSNEYEAMFTRDSDKISKKNGSLFPNPTSGIVHIPIRKLAEDHKLSYIVVNSMGQSVLSNIFVVAGAENFAIDLGTVPAGLYFIRVVNPDAGNDIFTVSKL
ncbi:MAG: T9SS type A sorting domain-containing protein [Saprospiraceae bacterium]